MAHPLRWTIFCFVIYLIVKNDKVNCQCTSPIRPAPEGCGPSTAELITTLVKELSPTGKNQLVNALLNIASNNGVLPDLSLLIQQSQANDNYAAASVGSVPQTLNVVPLVANIPTVCRSDPVPAKASVTSASLPTPSIESLYCIGLPQASPVPEPLPQNEFANSFSPAQFTSAQPQLSLNDIVYSICTPTYVVPDSCYQVIPPSPPSPSLPSSPSSPSTPSPQPLPSPSSPPSPTSIPSPTSPSSQTSSPSSSPQSLPSPPPSTSPPTSPSSIPINIPLDCVEILTNIGSQTIPFSSIFTSDTDMFPVNLEINLPAPNIPEPRITIVSAERPAPCPTVKKSSYLKKALPLLLIAMLCNERNNNACSCNCNAPNIVPIPYPIPIPVICPSCGNNYNDDENDDDDNYKQKQGNRLRREDLDAWDD